MTHKRTQNEIKEHLNVFNCFLEEMTQSKVTKPFIAPTAGVVVLRGKEQVLLVETKSQGNWGFPKGSREKGETSLVNALRELNEEAGLVESDIDLITAATTTAAAAVDGVATAAVTDTDGSQEYVTLDEMTPRNTLSCRYFVAVLRSSAHDKPVCALNPQEVLHCGYYSLEEASKLLKPSRRQVLEQAVAHVQQQGREKKQN